MDGVYNILHLISTAPSQVGNDSAQQDQTVAQYCLLLPGKTLHIGALLAAKRFRDRGNKEGAVKAIKLLQEAGLGTVIEIKPTRGASVVCAQAMSTLWLIDKIFFVSLGCTTIPEDEEEKSE